MKTNRPVPLALAAFGAALWIAGCASGRYNEDVNRYERRRIALEQRLAADPRDVAALRDLGVIHVRTARYARGYDLLKQAFAADAQDPEMLFYLGIASETVGDRSSAVRVYEKYETLPRLSPYRRLMVGRLGALVRDDARRQALELVAAEDTLRAGAPTSSRVVAVFPLQYRGDDARFAPIARGLSEMITVDLANVGSLRVVERVRMSALLDELRLSASSRVDPATAPRVGRLIGAGRVVGGAYSVVDGRTLRVDLSAWAYGEAPAPTLTSADDALAKFFQIEKALVFDLLTSMGVEPTPAERARIERIPTQNLQAFLAYSRALEREDAGDFRGAAGLFNQALRLDPAFGAAAGRAEATDGMATAGSTPESALAAAPEANGLAGNGLLDRRIGTLLSDLNAGLLPGIDNRKPAQEAPVFFPPPPPRPNPD